MRVFTCIQKFTIYYIALFLAVQQKIMKPISTYITAAANHNRMTLHNDIRDEFSK